MTSYIPMSSSGQKGVHVDYFDVWILTEILLGLRDIEQNTKGCKSVFIPIYIRP